MKITKKFLLKELNGTALTSTILENNVLFDGVHVWADGIDIAKRITNANASEIWQEALYQEGITDITGKLLAE